MNDFSAPDGPRFHDAAPILVVTDMQRSLQYYVELLGFTRAWECGSPVTQTAVARDQVEIILVQRDCRGGGGQAVDLEAEGDPRQVDPERGSQGAVYIAVDQIDALYQLFSLRLKIHSPLVRRDYGMREFEVLDPDGNQLVFAEQVD